MRKFKVGDSIIITKLFPQDERLGIKKGNIGVIVEKDYMQYNRYIVKIDKLPNPVPMLESQMEHLTINSSPSPDCPQEIKFPSIGELALNSLCNGYVKVDSDGIRINNDNININVEKEKNNMEILVLYKKRKEQKIEEKRKQDKEKAYDNDEIQKIINEMFKQINVILENEGREPVEVAVPFNYNELLTVTTKEKLDNIYKKAEEEFTQLNLECEEIRAMLSMTNDYQEQIKILKNYGIIDKKTNKLNV